MELSFNNTKRKKIYFSLRYAYLSVPLSLMKVLSFGKNQIKFVFSLIYPYLCRNFLKDKKINNK